MAKRVLQTRYVGMAPDPRHPLAPPEHVYQCEVPPRDWGFLRRCLLALAIIVAGALFIALP